MINATTSSSTPSPTGSPMPPAVGAGTTPSEKIPTTPSVVPPISAISTPVLPPQVLPSHSAPATHAARPLSAPHQDIAGLHKTLADKVGAQSSSPTPDSLSSTMTGGVGMPPSPIQPTIDTPVAPPPKKGGMGKVIIALALFLVAVVGASAAYYLSTQNQDTRQRAFTSTTQPTKLCNFLDIRGINENNSCPSLTSSAQMCENPSGTNNVSSYKNTYTLKNTIDKKIKLTVKVSSNSCPEGYGVKTSLGEGGACWRACFGDQDPNTPQVGSEPTREITLNPDQEQSIEISADSLITGQACGSMQLDLFLLKAVAVNDNGSDGEVLYDKAGQNVSQCGNVDASGLLGWGFCQTGNQCSPPQTTTKVSGGVRCYAGGKRYAVQGVSVSVDEKNFTTGSNGFYTSDGIAANKMVAARLTLPDTFNIQELDGNNNPTGAVMQASKSNLTKLNPNNPSHVINAYNGCAESATPNFMQENCGGVTAERQAQCTNAPMKDGFKAPGSYEYCSLQGGKDVRGGFDFAIYNCVTPPPTTTPQAACNEACDPTSNNCTQNATNTMSCVSTPNGEHRCRDTRFPTQENCQAPATPPPTGAMCMNLCGVANARATSSTSDFAQCPAGGGPVGTTQIKVGDYIHFKCQYRNATSVKILLVNEDGATVDLNAQLSTIDSTYKASYRVKKAGSVSARCEVRGIEAGNPPNNPPPNVSDDVCKAIGGNCNLQSGTSGGCARYQTPRTDIACGPSIENIPRVCCVNSTTAPPPLNPPVQPPAPQPPISGGSCANGTGNCKSTCGVGESGRAGNGCTGALLCCLPTSDM